MGLLGKYMKKWFAKVSVEYEEGCAWAFARENLIRWRAVCWTTVVVALCIVIYSGYHYARNDDAGYTIDYILAHAALVLLALIGLFIEKNNDRKNKGLSPAAITLGGILFMMWATSISAIDQTGYAPVSNFIIVSFLCSAIFILPPKHSMVMYLISFAVFVGVLNATQPDSLVYSGRMINAFIGIAFSMIISRTIYVYMTRSYIGQTTVKKQNESLMALKVQHEAELAIDPLTGIYNRRKFNEFFTREWRLALRHNHEISLFVFDIDYFKQYNDTYGHPKGDVCLQMVARALRSHFRRVDEIVARIGGEEFAILAAPCSVENARQIAQRALDAVRELKIPHSESLIADQVTVSIGFATTRPDADSDQTSFYNNADKAMYAAKATGKNRYAAYVEETTCAIYGENDLRELIKLPADTDMNPANKLWGPEADEILPSVEPFDRRHRLYGLEGDGARVKKERKYD